MRRKIAANEKPKNEGGRPRKVAELATGKEAANRFAAGLRFAIAGGAELKEKRK